MKSPSSAKKVLVYRLGSLGDTIVALPCFHLIRRSFPGAELTLLTNRPVKTKAAPIEAILGPRFFRTVVDYPVGLRNPWKVLALIRTIRAGRYDAVVHLSAFRGRKQAMRDAWFFRLAGIRRIFGLEAADDGAAAGGAGKLAEAEYRRLARRLAPLGGARVEDDASWDLELTPAERSEADRQLDLPGTTPFLVLGCGTKWRTNDWDEENWIRLTRSLGEAYPGHGLVVLGAAEERERSERMARVWPGVTRNLCGSTSPRGSAAVLSRARLFIGHDSGPLHLAACVGIPCVGIFSARNPPGRWFPRGRFTRVIYHRTECFGCGLELCETHGKKCILSISVEEVLETAVDVLEAKARVKKLGRKTAGGNDHNDAALRSGSGDQ